MKKTIWKKSACKSFWCDYKEDKKVADRAFLTERMRATF